MSDEEKEFGEIEYQFDVENYGYQVRLTISADRQLDEVNYFEMVESIIKELRKEEGDFILDAPHKGMN